MKTNGRIKSLNYYRPFIPIYTIHLGVENHAEETKLICDQNAITALPASTKVERSQKPFGGRDGNEQQDASRQLLGEQTRKEEDRWDKFIECLLFFCCVG